MNPYAAPAETGLREEAVPGRSRAARIAMNCAGFVILFYVVLGVIVVTGYEEPPAIKTVLVLGMLLMLLASLAGFASAAFELLRRRGKPLVPALALVVNGSALAIPLLAQNS